MVVGRFSSCMFSHMYIQTRERGDAHSLGEMGWPMSWNRRRKMEKETEVSCGPSYRIKTNGLSHSGETKRMNLRKRKKNRLARPFSFDGKVT